MELDLGFLVIHLFELCKFLQLPLLIVRGHFVRLGVVGLRVGCIGRYQWSPCTLSVDISGLPVCHWPTHTRIEGTNSASLENPAGR